MDLYHVKCRRWSVLPFLLYGLLILYGGSERNDSMPRESIWGGGIITPVGFLSGLMNFSVTEGRGDRGKESTFAKEDHKINNRISRRVISSNGEGFHATVYFSGRNNGREELHSEDESVNRWDGIPDKVSQFMHKMINVKYENLMEDARRGGLLLERNEISHFGWKANEAINLSPMDEEESIKWKWKKEKEESASVKFGPNNKCFFLSRKEYSRMGRILSSANEDHPEESTIGVPNGDDTFEGSVLNIHFTENRNLYTNVKVGGQPLKLALNSRVEGIYVFMKDSQACYVGEEGMNRICYDPKTSRNSTWCNNDLLCLPAILSRPYECYSDSNLLLENKAEYPSMYYDSLKFTESHVEGSDDVELLDWRRDDRATNETSSANPINNLVRRGEDNTFQNTDIKLITDLSVYNGWSLFKDTDGMMGLAGRELSCRHVSAWNSIIEKNKSLYALDVNLPEGSVKPFVESASQNDSKKVGSSYGKFVSKKASTKKGDAATERNGTISEIHIGDYKKNFGPIVWSEARERGGIFSDSFMQFTLYNLQVCENNIFGKYSSNWQGVIDLSSKCLVLPKMFWLSLMEYLPVNKNDERCIPKNKEVNFDESTIPRMCSVDPRSRPLPVLKFYLSDNDIVSDNNVGGMNGASEEASQRRGIEQVHIPLDNLIINEEGQNDGYLCVLPDVHEGVSSENSGRTTKPLIKFGTYVINNLYVVVDQENYKVGFVNKKDYHFTNDRCTQRPVCIGNQFYEPALNICVDPDCSVWYFYTLNEETKKCESISSRFYVFLFILLLLLFMDIQSYYFYRKSVHVAKVSSR
ncbi:conserved Plasmodium protein, unknown function [Plasmodium knowlesi strain H]|uniref:Erythrocyte membrane-associated antigen n=3 Tax=Plasmodium knowlesi TaxID=5850 RepID=A0A5K1VRF9_PLAKH|nr:peptidase, putative [Plasmodium knowlesi strain H]OTN68372.1 putative Erythrocyte membrane-associated antigen [Plasmodium knowlesi]CAA9987075.1 peptidase, putative [Plasmodium knowlesi strain H]SBO23802.1 conserved Plasmodium protein, unknown function [Plasmodium knowlesi strain H]SBO25545.1 conserved Plasmodium protein, unknown function [Plasmodium knowlesi strain H]VVS76549.1 peptidase, putative [Plasmodium knowlesi strain H]|eukprot:XP_002261698.1 Erythrocyte membrane-associated antigen,putative [Plasmodium knowlesi strain H]